MRDGQADSQRSSSGRWAFVALPVVSGLAVGYLALLALLAYSSENVESPNPGYVILAAAGGTGFAVGVLGMGKRWSRPTVLVCLLAPLLAAGIATAFLDLDTAA